MNALLKINTGYSIDLILFNPNDLINHYVNNQEEPKYILGYISIQNSAECSNTYEIVNSIAQKGLGPLLYDMALSSVYPQTVVPDRTSISQAAENVWKFYFHKRNDVQKYPVDNNCKLHNLKHLDTKYSFIHPQYQNLISISQKSISKTSTLTKLSIDELKELIYEDAEAFWNNNNPFNENLKNYISNLLLDSITKK